MVIDIDVVNLTLGIVGTLSGVISLTVHLWRLKRENPRLDLKVLNCEHSFEAETNAISFWSAIELRNLGDRGTNILGTDLMFEYDNKDYVLKMSDQDCDTEENPIKWIRPHETIRNLQVAFTKFEIEPRNSIDCTFTIYHTHGAEKIKTKSLKKVTTKTFSDF
jgi:hypothetical protein